MKEITIGILPISLVYIAVASLIKCLFSTAIFARRLHLLNKLVVKKDITHANKEKIISQPSSHKTDKSLPDELYCIKIKRILRANNANKNGMIRNTNTTRSERVWKTQGRWVLAFHLIG